MATAKTKPASLEELDTQLASEANEIEVNDPGNPNELYFEDGPLAGKKATIKQFEKGEVEVADPSAPTKEQKADDVKTTDQVVEAKPVDGEETEVVTEVPAKDAKEVETQVVEAYKPNTKMKVYDQEKDFPDWAKPLATSKESEENLRSTLQRAEAFDTIRVKHDNVVKERDENRSMVNEHVERVTRMDGLREKNLPLYIHHMNVSPKDLISYAANLAHMQDNDPEAYAQHLRELDSGVQNFNQEFMNQRASANTVDTTRQLHQEVVQATMTAPEVASFKQRMDAVHGNGAFERQFNDRGSLIFKNEGRYAHPKEIAQWVMSTWGTSIPPVTAAPATTTQVPTAQPTTTPAPAHVAPRPAPQRVKTLPNFGRGSNSSPTRVRPKSFAELEKVIDSDS